MNIQERRNKDGKITSYRIRVFDHRDTQSGRQDFRRQLSIVITDTESVLLLSSDTFSSNSFPLRQQEAGSAALPKTSCFRHEG